MMKAVLRFGTAVLIVSGSLLLCDAALTLAWEEPLTSFLAARAQADLNHQLHGDGALVRRDERRIGAVHDPHRRLRLLARAAAGRARVGRAVGRIELPTLGRSYAFVQGTDTASLERGPGHFPKTPFPGQGGTVAVAGHRTTYLAPFRTINELRRHDRIVLTMPYGRFTYAVTGTRVVAPTALAILRPVGYEQLVLTACDPLYSAVHRIAVFARLRSAAPTATTPRPTPTGRRARSPTAAAR